MAGPIRTCLIYTAASPAPGRRNYSPPPRGEATPHPALRPSSATTSQQRRFETSPSYQAPVTIRAALIEVIFIRNRDLAKKEKRRGRHVRKVCPGNMIQGVTSIGAKMIAVVMRSNVKAKVVADLQRAGYVHDPSFNMKRPPPGPNGARPTRDAEKFAIEAAYRRNIGGATYNRYVPARRFYENRALEVARLHPEWCRAVDQSLADLKAHMSSTRGNPSSPRCRPDLRAEIDRMHRDKSSEASDGHGNFWLRGLMQILMDQEAKKVCQSLTRPPGK